MAGNKPQAQQAQDAQATEKKPQAQEAQAAETKPKFGAGHLQGMLRKGFTEIGQYLPAFNTAGQQTIEDPGVFPNATQMEINNVKGVKGFDAEQGQTKQLSMEDFRKAAKERADAAAERMGNGHGPEQQSGNDVHGNEGNGM